MPQEVAGDQPEVTRYEGQSLSFVDDWRRLAAESGSYFQSPAWVTAWWRHLAGQPPTLIATWRTVTGALGAVACMSRVRERLHPRLFLSAPVWVNSGSGIGAGDHLGFPATASLRQPVRRWISSLPGAVRLNNLCEGQGTDLPAPWLAVERTATFRRLLDGGEAIGSRSTLKDLRRCERRLTEQDITFEILAGPRISTEVVDALFDLHAERFSSVGRMSSFDRSRRAQLIDLCGQGVPSMEPIAVVARRRGDIVGVDWSFVAGRNLLGYQSGWSQSYRRHSLGLVLILKSMEWALSQQLQVADFLRGAEEFKDRFGTTTHWDVSYLRPKGPAGKALRLKAYVRQRLRSRVSERGLS